MSALMKPNLNIFDFSSREQALQTCKDIIDSDLCPKWAKGNPGNLLLVFMKGFELGLTVNQAMEGMCIINGKVSMYGDVLLGYCLALSNCEYIEEEFDSKKHNYICISKRKDRRKEVVREFGIERAEKAGYLKKEGPWRQMPERMMQMRARSFSLRDNWADKLMGIVAYEEALDCGSRSNVVEHQPRVLEATKNHLNFLIDYLQLPQQRINNMLAWAEVKSVDLMSEVKAMWAIRGLEKENPEASKAWKTKLLASLEIKMEEGEDHAN
jgi:hypothetical protein